jgi:hypothetical protein
MTSKGFSLPWASPGPSDPALPFSRTSLSWRHQESLGPGEAQGSENPFEVIAVLGGIIENCANYSFHHQGGLE